MVNFKVEDGRIVPIVSGTSLPNLSGEPEPTIYESKGKVYFLINELEIEAKDADIILSSDYGYSRDQAIYRLVKALKYALDSTQNAYLDKMAEE